MPKDNSDLLKRRAEYLAQLDELNFEASLLKREMRAVETILQSRRLISQLREQQNGQKFLSIFGQIMGPEIDSSVQVAGG